MSRSIRNFVVFAPIDPEVIPVLRLFYSQRPVSRNSRFPWPKYAPFRRSSIVNDALHIFHLRGYRSVSARNAPLKRLGYTKFQYRRHGEPHAVAEWIKSDSQSAAPLSTAIGNNLLNKNGGKER